MNTRPSRHRRGGRVLSSLASRAERSRRSASASELRRERIPSRVPRSRSFRDPAPFVRSSTISEPPSGRRGLLEEVDVQAVVRAQSELAATNSRTTRAWRRSSWSSATKLITLPSSRLAFTCNSGAPARATGAEIYTQWACPHGMASAPSGRRASRLRQAVGSSSYQSSERSRAPRGVRLPIDVRGPTGPSDQARLRRPPLAVTSPHIASAPAAQRFQGPGTPEPSDVFFATASSSRTTTVTSPF